MPHDPQRVAECRAWLDRAWADLDSVTILLSSARPRPDTALFHCQQAVEKAINNTNLAEELEFVMAQRSLDEATVLGQAVRIGVRALYREALVEAYLMGRIPRQQALQRLGPEQLEEVEYQRDALRRDVDWGSRES